MYVDWFLICKLISQHTNEKLLFPWNKFSWNSTEFQNWGRIVFRIHLPPSISQCLCLLCFLGVSNPAPFSCVHRPSGSDPNSSLSAGLAVLYSILQDLRTKLGLPPRRPQKTSKVKAHHLWNKYEENVYLHKIQDLTSYDTPDQRGYWATVSHSVRFDQRQRAETVYVLIWIAFHNMNQKSLKMTLHGLETQLSIGSVCRSLWVQNPALKTTKQEDMQSSTLCKLTEHFSACKTDRRRMWPHVPTAWKELSSLLGDMGHEKHLVCV